MTNQPNQRNPPHGAVAQQSSGAFLTEKELAERWSISVKTLQKARYTGTGITVPFVKLGSRVRYRLQDIVNYEAENLISL